ncbi:uroporphyrin-III C-methyltransferase [Marininema mesophilum]|uniref:Uroporphyrinogen-III C-methyltransferase n=1 Tax=Marininema mesophilum TaxID=1048340 RepID=A0A1H2S0F1_9BACL|nr:uroporphyrinogen-III C-methyltransferase [Marininema mesophilum]SDW25048.1 uroporphyrin-III C-methyltransferase [Marininema mesophilum]
MTGKVYLVGTGPGDPGLITVRALELIQQADVILYDRLVNPELLHHATYPVQLIYCGKQAGNHTLSQTEIQQVLVEQARKKRTVVRLKGGDPGIFGRVGEEAAYCAQHHIPFEIVPGVTSGAAASLYAGIPLTHRGISGSVAFVTGHRCGKEEQEQDWIGLLKQVDTVVIYMGMEKLPSIQQQMLIQGCDNSTPVAIIEWGTMAARQLSVTGTLDDIVGKVKQYAIQSPAIIVLGEVVHLREKLAWFEAEQEAVSRSMGKTN